MTGKHSETLTEALRAVPRHGFVPPVGVALTEDGPRLIDRDADPQVWWSTVYGPDAIVTQLDCGATDLRELDGRYTSSNSAPGTVVDLLTLLDPRPGHRVLEVGTGTGWTAGLLSQLVGDHTGVTSIEVDGAVSEQAAKNLAAAGMRPRLVVGDGSGARSTTRVDPRTIAYAPAQAGLAMSARTGLDVRVADGDRFILYVVNPADAGRWAAVVHRPDGEHLTYQLGDRPLWDEITDAYFRWVSWGEPGRDRFGMTITPEGQSIWLDTPDRVLRGRPFRKTCRGLPDRMDRSPMNFTTRAGLLPESENQGEAMSTNSLPPVVDADTWQRQLEELRAREKAATRELDAIAAQRRRLPMVRMPDYTLEGEDGPVRLADVFDGKRQLIVYNHMWFPGKQWQCPGCTGFTSQFTRPEFLDAYDARFVIVTQGPIDEALAYKRRVGNKLPWYSTADSPFGADVGTPPGGGFALNVFLRDGDTVYRTWHTTGRGIEQLTHTFALIDVLPYGRQEEWQDSPDGWPQSPTYSRWPSSEDIAARYGAETAQR